MSPDLSRLARKRNFGESRYGSQRMTLLKRKNLMIEQLKERADEMFGDQPNGVNAGIEPAENALAFVVALGATFLARNALQAGWRTALNSEPPKNPASHEVNWRDALIWGAVSGAVVGAVRIASRRASSGAYRNFWPERTG